MCLSLLSQEEEGDGAGACMRTDNRTYMGDDLNIGLVFLANQFGNRFGIPAAVAVRDEDGSILGLFNRKFTELIGNHFKRLASASCNTNLNKAALVIYMENRLELQNVTAVVALTRPPRLR